MVRWKRWVPCWRRFSAWFRSGVGARARPAGRAGAPARREETVARALAVARRALARVAVARRALARGAHRGAGPRRAGREASGRGAVLAAAAQADPRAPAAWGKGAR